MPGPAAKDSVRVADMLSRAFQIDSLFNFLIPDRGVRGGLLPSFFGVVVRYCAAYGAVDAVGEGAACWLPPGHPSAGLGRLFRIGLALPRLWSGFPKLGWQGFRRLRAMSAYTDTLHRRLAPTPHWYLWVLGVEPAQQGRGLGGQLLQAGLARAEAEGKPCYLETNEAANLAFYQKHGFKVVSEGQVPGYALAVWAMRREATKGKP